MRSRRVLVLAALLVALAVVFIARHDRSTPRTTSIDRPAKHTEAVSVRPVSANAPSDVSDQTAPSDRTTPTPPAPPTEPVKTERPAPKQVTQDDFVARRENGLQLLDDTIARVQRERDEATTAGDNERVSLARVRLERLAAVRKQRAEELEEARRGELTPNPDDLPAGPRPEGNP